MNALTPHGTLNRRGDGRKRRQRFVFLRVFQRDGQRAVAAHRMAHDAAARDIRVEVGGDDFRQLVDHVAVHAVVGCPGRLRGIQIESRGDAEVPANHDRRVVRTRGLVSGATSMMPMARRVFERAGLGHEGFFGAGEAGEVVQHRHRARRGLRRRVHRKAHVAVVGLRRVLVIAQHAPEAGVPGNRCE